MMKNKYGRIVIFAMMIVMACMMASCGSKKEAPALSETYDGTILSVSSESVRSTGKLKTICACDQFTYPAGENKSPALSYDAVEGAAYYVIIMYDVDCDNFLHWYSFPVFGNDLEEGIYSNPTVYVGPYPPEGDKAHHYRIRVYALKDTPDELPVLKTGDQIDVNAFETAIDTVSGNQGNVLAIGELACEYGFGDETK